MRSKGSIPLYHDHMHNTETSHSGDESRSLVQHNQPLVTRNGLRLVLKHLGAHNLLKQHISLEWLRQVLTECLDEVERELLRVRAQREVVERPVLSVKQIHYSIYTRSCIYPITTSIQYIKHVGVLVGMCIEISEHNGP